MLSINEFITKKHVKISAYNALLELKVNSLPVDPVRAMKVRSDIKLYSLTFYKNYGWDDSDFKKAFGSYGSAIYDKKLNKYFVFYNDHNPKQYVRWALSALLAAIELDLVDSANYFSVTYKDDGDSDLFAQYFTAPDAILNSINIFRPEEIMANCSIPFDKAYRKSQNLKFSQMGRKVTIEKMLRFVFDDYIESFENNKKPPGATNTKRL